MGNLRCTHKKVSKQNKTKMQKLLKKIKTLANSNKTKLRNPHVKNVRILLYAKDLQKSHF